MSGSLAWFTATETGQLTSRALLYGLSFILLDSFILYSPTATLIPRIFGPKYKARKHAKRLVSQVAARVVGAVFLISMFPMAFSVISSDKFKADKLYHYEDQSITCLLLAAGYFLYDSFICITRFDENGPAFLLHGVFCMLAYWYAATSHHIHYYGAVFLLWELSTPLLYVRWAMLKAGKADTAMMNVVNFSFMAVFFSCRIIYGTIMSYDFFTVTKLNLESPNPGAFPRGVTYGYWAAAISLNGLNFFWFYQMASAALGINKKAEQIKKGAATSEL